MFYLKSHLHIKYPRWLHITQWPPLSQSSSSSNSEALLTEATPLTGLVRLFSPPARDLLASCDTKGETNPDILLALSVNTDLRSLSQPESGEVLDLSYFSLILRQF